MVFVFIGVVTVLLIVNYLQYKKIQKQKSKLEYTEDIVREITKDLNETRKIIAKHDETMVKITKIRKEAEDAKDKVSVADNVGVADSLNRLLSDD